MTVRKTGAILFALGVGVTVLGAACGSSRDGFAEFSEAGTFTGEDGGDGACTGFACEGTVTCQAGQKTRISGTVYDPAGKVPLYNAAVYIPSKPLDAITPGASCERCGAKVINPLASTLSDSKGRFSLDVDVLNKDTKLVVQIGKWRRAVPLQGNIKACQDNELGPDLTRLPRSQAEGDLPQIAIGTGPCDAFQCLLRRMGVDDSEFTDDLGKGRIHLYQGTLGGKAKGGTSVTGGLWFSATNLARYDVVMSACECAPITRTSQQIEAMHQYANNGGRVIGTHYQYTWFQGGPDDFKSTASWTPDGTANISGNYAVDLSFPKGKAFGEWLVNVGASSSLGRINLDQVKGDVNGVNASKAQRWIYDENPERVKYFTFNTPVGSPADQQCGRVTFSDIHVATNGTGDLTDNAEFPEGCQVGDLAPQEKALEFLLFDLTSCVQSDSEPPTPIR